MAEDIILSASQDAFLRKLNTKFRAFVGGFGSGKTFVGCIDDILFKASNPKTVTGYYGPSYPSIRDIYYPTYAEAAEKLGFRAVVRENNKEVHLYRGRRYYGTSICRSMDNPSAIVGYKTARSHVDEIDTIPRNKAEQSWRNITARLRLVVPGVENVIGVTTTPEGFRFVYDRFARDPSPRYSMVQASTYENEEYLPDDYIDSLLETYPEHLIGPYLKGEFANLTSGQIYRSYDRIKHRSTEVIEPRDILYVGQDFNVNRMASTIYVRRGVENNEWHAVSELVDLIDTPDLIATLKLKFSNHKIVIYPDASGSNTSTKSANVSDISMLRQAGFRVKVNKKNPPVRDRINSVNGALDHGKMFVNDLLCPNVANCLEQQTYNENGEPEKGQGKDHQNDATGYPIVSEMPVRRKRALVPNSQYSEVA